MVAVRVIVVTARGSKICSYSLEQPIKSLKWMSKVSMNWCLMLHSLMPISVFKIFNRCSYFPFPTNQLLITITAEVKLINYLYVDLFFSVSWEIFSVLSWWIRYPESSSWVDRTKDRAQCVHWRKAYWWLWQ